MLDFIGATWHPPSSQPGVPVLNPATGELLGHTPEGSAEAVAEAVQAASAAFPEWRATPPAERIQYLFRLKQLLEEHFEEIARITTTENGKTLAESRGELRRGIENVEVACGIPTMMQGYNLEEVARGIDESMFRQPLGAVAAITPFNLPAIDPAVVSPLCDRLRQYAGAEALGAGPVHDDWHYRTDREHRPSNGCGESGERR